MVGINEIKHVKEPVYAKTVHILALLRVRGWTNPLSEINCQKLVGAPLAAPAKVSCVRMSVLVVYSGLSKKSCYFER